MGHSTRPACFKYGQIILGWHLMVHLPYFSNEYLQKSRDVLENATKNLDAFNP